MLSPFDGRIPFDLLHYKFYSPLPTVKTGYITPSTTIKFFKTECASSLGNFKPGLVLLIIWRGVGENAWKLIQNGWEFSVFHHLRRSPLLKPPLRLTNREGNPNRKQ